MMTKLQLITTFNEIGPVMHSWYKDWYLNEQHLILDNN